MLWTLLASQFRSLSHLANSDIFWDSCQYLNDIPSLWSPPSSHPWNCFICKLVIYFHLLQLTALKLGSGDLLQVTDHLKIEIFETVKYCGGVFEAYAGNVGGGDICLRYCELLCRYFWWWLLLQAKKEEEERERRERREQRAVDRSEKFWYFEFWYFEF